MKKKTAVICVFTLAWLAYALFTGGIVIDIDKGFGGQRNVALSQGPASALSLWVDPNRSEVGLPFIGFVYSNHLPYGLRVEIYDADQIYSLLTIETVTVAYRDGEESTVNTAWTRALEPHTVVNSSSEGLIHTPMMVLSDTIPAVITRHEDCDVTLKGFLTHTDGTHTPFEVVETFEYEYSFRIYTVWLMLMNAG